MMARSFNRANSIRKAATSRATLRTRDLAITAYGARAQAWGLVYTAIALAHRPQEKRWMEQLLKGADWWLANVPPDGVAFWDFHDPAIPDTERDTAATAIACSALLKLAELAPSVELRAQYRSAAEQTATALVDGFLTPVYRDGDR